MYFSLCDGKANSQNRFKTDLISKNKIYSFDKKEKEVLEYTHNDFEPCFDTYDKSKWIYKSKLEWAWDFNFANLNKNWDQKRYTENWTGKHWKTFEGKKWGYFELIRYQREIERSVKMKSLQNKIAIFFEGKNEDEIDDLTGSDNYQKFKNEFLKEAPLKPVESSKIDELSFIKYIKVLNEFEFQLIKIDVIVDIDINPDSSRYLGVKEKQVEIDKVIENLKNSDIANEDELINFFRNNFISNKIIEIKLIDEFDVIQGTQFSKRDAYLYPGKIPVFTAATDGPAYYVSEDIPNKVKIKGPSLIWSRKGAKAGTIQIFDLETDFFISDVSGTIKPKKQLESLELLFLKYYIAGQVKRELQSKSNNAQLNKTKLENLKIFMPDNMKEIGQYIKSIL